MKKIMTAISLVALCSTAACTMDNADHHMNNDHMNMSRSDKASMMAQTYMEKMDTNNDGMISRQEIRAGNDKMFRMTDTNHDGMLSLDEVTAMKMKEIQMMHDHHMTNRDNGMMNENRAMNNDTNMNY